MCAMEGIIRISKETKDVLDIVKSKEGHSSYDSVIRSLIERIVLTKRINQSTERKIKVEDFKLIGKPKKAKISPKYIEHIEDIKEEEMEEQQRNQDLDTKMLRFFIAMLRYRNSTPTIEECQKQLPDYGYSEIRLSVKRIIEYLQKIKQ